MSAILVVTELQNNEFKKSSFETVSQARRLADSLGQTVTALVIGSDVKAKAASLGEYGADQVLTAEDTKLENFNPDYYKTIVIEAVKKVSPEIVLFIATLQGRDLAPRVAAALETGLASDCTGLEVVDGSLEIEHPLYAGKVFAKLSLESPVKILSLRPGVFEAKMNGKQAVVNSLELPALESRIKIKEINKTGGDKLDVTEADIIVTGGRGVRSAENFKIIEELATVLNAAVGATRAVVDSEWRPHDEQVGQTGKVVSPSLYIMCGASGSIQHWAGMSGSKCIVAVNKDPEAPIIKRADYSIVGDLFEVVPALTQEIKKIKG
ncbi:electron transfer flavoprotein subunit alpha/FixB family protein [candidate division KSB1 bacterium]|nr:electron transfer flavoprotein subunit alpha/FixB family protein [candidate division KSB1 bacterium]